MPASKLSSKGQLVIPKDIRELMRLQPGDRIEFLVRDDEEVVIRPVVGDLQDLKGMLKRPGRKPVALSAMNKAIRKRASST
ncbi:MAG: AbrB/MazE/SpoVT family DNA-binding domain-containing protein [Acidobacteriota bacterium]